jgi:hypothetical protein
LPLESKRLTVGRVLLFTFGGETYRACPPMFGR